MSKNYSTRSKFHPSLHLARKGIPFRERHLIEFLEEFESQEGPLDFAIHRYFRAHKSLGSKDRAFIAETVYGMMRWKNLLDCICHRLPPTWEERIKLWQEDAVNVYHKDSRLPLWARYGCPEFLFTKLIETYGESAAKRFCLANTHPAPLTVRANSIKTTQKALLELWKEFHVSPCLKAPLGIHFPKRINFFELDEFQNGLFEVQDEGSQLIAELVKTKPGQQVLDFCAGGGGKALAIAPKLANRGQIYLHDIRSQALKQARQRLNRAGVQNGQFLDASSLEAHPQLKKKMDWVLVDVPCSGTGTLRRNPDMKWKLNQEILNRLQGQQRLIFEKALRYLKPKIGCIVYATCSVLREENEEQIAYFLKTHSLKLVEPFFQSLPLEEGQMDGFFGAVMTWDS